MCKDALAAFRDGLPRLIEDPQDRAARARALYAAWYCSTALSYVSMAHVFGGSFDTPHAETHAILLPYTTAFNESVVPDLLRPIAEPFRRDSAAGGLWDFAQSVDSPLSLKAIGVKESDLDRATTTAVKNAYANPQPIEPGSIRKLLQAAWDARRPVG